MFFNKCEYRVHTVLFIKHNIKDLNSVINYITSQHIFLIVRDPQNARKLVEGGVPIKQLCIGNMHTAEGKQPYKEAHVYMDAQDLDDLRAIKAKGVDVYIQIAPGDRKYSID